MPYEIVWLVPEHIVMLRGLGQLTQSDLQAAVSQLQAEIYSLPSQVHIIIDNRDLHTPPTAIDSITADSANPYSVGYTLLLDRNPVARLVGSVIANALGSPTHSIQNMDEGFSFLQAMDPRLQKFSE